MRWPAAWICFAQTKQKVMPHLHTMALHPSAFST